MLLYENADILAPDTESNTISRGAPHTCLTTKAHMGHGGLGQTTSIGVGGLVGPVGCTGNDIYIMLLHRLMCTVWCF